MSRVQLAARGHRAEEGCSSALSTPAGALTRHSCWEAAAASASHGMTGMWSACARRIVSTGRKGWCRRAAPTHLGGRLSTVWMFASAQDQRGEQRAKRQRLLSEAMTARIKRGMIRCGLRLWSFAP